MELTALNRVLFVDKETVITADFLNNVQEVIEAHHSAIVVVNTALEGKADALHVHEIADVTGLEDKLETFATVESVEALNEALEGVATASHKHEIVDINGLGEKLATFVTRETLAEKADKAHEHEIADIRELAEKLASFITEEDVIGLLETYVAEGDLERAVASLTEAIEKKAEKTHNHSVDDIEGLEAKLETFITADEVAGLIPETDFSTIEGQINAVEEKLDGKADKSHNHALADIEGLTAALSEFVTNSALVEQLKTKADSEHQHSILNVAGLTEALAERYTKSEVDTLLTEIEVDLSPVETKIEEVAGDVATLKEASTSQAQTLETLESDVEELTAIVTDLTIVEIDDAQETSATVWSSAKTKQEIENAVQSVDVTIENATTEVAGLMSAEDKKKLDGINPAETTEIKEDVELLREASATQAQSLETVKATADSAKTVATSANATANELKSTVDGMTSKLDKIDENAPRIYAQADAPQNPIAGTIWIKVANK